MNDPMSPRMQTLLDHRAWVRDLARRLVRDPGVADDVAQEALLAALESSAPPPRSIRAWLGTVVRNLVWERMRGEDRRHVREERVAREEETPSTLELLEEVAVHREVVETLMALPEHYRDVLVRRYYEGETPTRIAEASGVPVATVKTRLQRGLALMRQRLDGNHGGDGRSWVAALAPLSGFGRGSGSEVGPGAGTLTSTGVQGSMVAATIALIATVGVIVGVLLTTKDPAPTDPVALAGRATDAPPAPAGDGLERIALPARGDASSVAPTDLPWGQRRVAERAALEFHPTRQTGRVYDLAGRPVPGVLVRFEPDAAVRAAVARTGAGAPLALTDGEGGFELMGVRGSGRVVATRHDLVTTLAGEVDGLGSGEVTLVVAPAVGVTGSVTDEEGRPLVDVQVEIRPPADLRSRLGLRVDRSSLRSFFTSTDATGAFRFDGAPRLEGALLVARHEGYLTHEGPLEPTAAGLEIVLARPAPGPGWRHGTVLDAAGAPVPNARVSTGTTVTRTDAQGSFALDLEGVERLIAVRAGPGTTTELPGIVEPDGGAWPDPLVLRLGRAPARIAGVVRDPDGAPLPGVRVWVADPTVFRPGKRPYDEDGERVHSVRRRLEDFEPGERAELLENLLVEHGGGSWRRVTTDAEGAFVLEGLLERSYTLVAMDRYTLRAVESAPIPAGTEDLVLTLDATDVRPRIHGRIVSRSGVPLAGAQVWVHRNVLEIRRGDQLITSEGVLRRGGTSREDGAFEVDDVPAEGVSLWVEGAGLVTTGYGEESGQSLEGTIEIVVPRRHEMRVLSAEGDAFTVLDGAGEELDTVVIEGGRRLLRRRTPLFDGASEIVGVEDTAATLVLYEGERELRRVPLHLAAGRVNELRP